MPQQQGKEDPFHGLQRNESDYDSTPDYDASDAEPTSLLEVAFGDLSLDDDDMQRRSARNQQTPTAAPPTTPAPPARADKPARKTNRARPQEKHSAHEDNAGEEDTEENDTDVSNHALGIVRPEGRPWLTQDEQLEREQEIAEAREKKLQDEQVAKDAAALAIRIQAEQLRKLERRNRILSAVIFALVITLLIGIPAIWAWRHWNRDPRPPQPPPPPPDPAKCFLVGSSQDFHTPAGIYGPISAMINTFALEPHYTLQWLSKGSMPLVWPQHESTNRDVRHLASDLHNALQDDFFFPKGQTGSVLGQLRSWWRRQNKPAIEGTSVSSNLRLAREAQSWSTFKRFWKCSLPLTRRSPTCSAVASTKDPLTSMSIVFNVTALARQSCLGSESSVPGPDLSKTLEVVEKLLRAVDVAADRIALQEMERVKHARLSVSAASIETPSATAAPWSPPVGRSNGKYELVEPFLVYGVRVPSLSAEQELHQLRS